MSFNPSSNVAMEAGTTLIALGPIGDLEKLAGILSGDKRRSSGWYERK